MPVDPGTRFGPYEIVSLLGEGGMGEVYCCSAEIALASRSNRSRACGVDAVRAGRILSATPRSRPVSRSPDCRSIAFVADIDGPAHVYVRALAGGDDKAVSHIHAIQFTNDWLRDGRILFQSEEPKSGSDIFITRGDGQDEPWLQTPLDEARARVSPDQRWVAYISNASGRSEVYVTSFDRGGSGRVRVSTDGGHDPAWSGDGKEIYWMQGHALFAAGEAHADVVRVPGVLAVVDGQRRRCRFGRRGDPEHRIGIDRRRACARG